MTPDPGLDRFNRLPDAAAQLSACCASSAWIGHVVAGRPYPDRSALQAVAEVALAQLDWAGVREAVDAHPRIGERTAAAGTEASWSRVEQSGMDTATEETRAALVEANRAYEERFGHVFLIFATGRTDAEMLAVAGDRLLNDDETERSVVRGELDKIVALRLTKLLDALAVAG